MRESAAGVLETVLAGLRLVGEVTGVASSQTVYAIVSAAHVLGIGLLIGAIVLVDLRLVGLVRTLDDRAVMLLRRTAAVGVILAVTAGILLFSAKPFEYAGNVVMQIKLGVVCAAISNALAFEAALRRKRRLGAHEPAPFRATWRGVIAGAASLSLWPAALLLGRWVAFT